MSPSETSPTPSADNARIADMSEGGRSGTGGPQAMQVVAAQEKKSWIHKWADTGSKAPPDLEKLRSAFTSGVDALRRGDGAAAVKDLGSFTFGSRAVEEYRLWYLANAHQLDAD